MNTLQHATAQQPITRANHSVSEESTASHGCQRNTRMTYSSGNNRRGTGRSQTRRTRKTASVSHERKLEAYQNAIHVFRARLQEASEQGSEASVQYYTGQIQKYEELVGMSAE